MVHLGPTDNAALLNYTTAGGTRSTVLIQTWDVPWESGTGENETTGDTVRVLFNGDEWMEIP